MKKNLVALLLVLAVVSVGVFAAPTNPDPVYFDVTASVTGRNLMKFTSVDVSNSISAFNNSDNAWTETTVGASDYTSGLKKVAFISIASNHRKGVIVSMVANAMKSILADADDAYINYEIALGNGGASSTSGASPVENDDVFGTASSTFTGMTVMSKEIKISVSADDLANAVEGEYSGRITFTYTAK